jgi:hypothetical protein
MQNEHSRWLLAPTIVHGLRDAVRLAWHISRFDYELAE